MANGAGTSYTTYLRTELDPVSRTSYSQLRALAESTYRDIGIAAERASNVTSAALGDRRQTAALRSVETAATSTFATIRREATSTGAAVSAMQARLSNIRTSSIAGAVGGVAPSSAGNIRAAAAANDNLSASNRRLSATTVQVTDLQRRQSVTTRAVGEETGRLSRSLTVLGTTLSVVQGPLGPIAGRINAITSAVTTLGTGTLVLAGAATALFAFAGVANVYAEVESRLRPLYTTQEQVNGALRETGRIALATRSALAPTADLYAKLTSAGRDYNLTSRQVSRVTETAAKAATLSGGNEASREAGLYQFSQGLASGKLGGDELRSILENIPELARAIAIGFKNADGSIGTTIGNLRKLGAEGALSTSAIVESLDRSAALIDAKFSKLPKTISSAKTEFVTSFTLLTGQIDQTVGVTSTLANTISIAAQNLQVLLALGGAFAARFVLPKLGAFLADQRRAIDFQRQLNAQTAVAQGRLGGTLVTPLTPTGIDRAKAATAEVNARAAADEARARVAAEQQIVAAIDGEITTTKTATEVDREKTRSAQANARFDVAAIEQRVAALRAELAVRVENRALAQTTVDTITRSAPLVTRPLQSGEQDVARTARITAFTAQQTEAKLALAQADLRASATARSLAAAEIQLEGATAGATAAILTQTQAANQNAARGFALLGLAEQRAAANVALAATSVELTAAETALAAAEVRLTAAQVAFNTVASVGTRVMTGLAAGGRAVVAALGGPLVIALTAVTGAMIYLAGQTNAALDALHNFAGGQEELNRRLGITTDKLNEQSAAARDLALALAQANVVKARTARADANQDLAGSVGTLASNIAPGVGGRLGNVVAGALPGLATAQQRQAAQDSELLFRLQSQLKSGGAISARGRETLNSLLARYPDAARDSGFDGSLNRFAGRAAGDTANKVLGTEAARLTQSDAEKTLAEVKAELAKPRVAPKPPAKPLTAAEILARGTAGASALADPKAKAQDTLDDARKRILGNKNLTDDEKIAEIAEATAAYNAQVVAIDKRDARASRAIAAKAEREHAKEVREAEKATRQAAAATERLNDLRARYDDSPKLVDQVRNDQRAFQALVGKNINVTDEDGKTTRRQYTAADAAADQGKAQAALNKPFTDMTREMERQAQIQTLTLQGRDAEADALNRSYQLIDRTGTLQAGQFATLVQLAEQQDRINSALEERGRIVGTLRSAVDSLRDGLTSFLDTLPDKAAQVGKRIRDADGDERRYGGLDFIKDSVGGLAGGVFGQFRSQANRLGVDSLFGGVQKKIDDLISGRTGLQDATAFAATQTNRTGSIVQRFGDVVSDVADRVQAVLADFTTGGASGAVGPFAGSDLPGLVGSAILSDSDLDKEISDLGKRLRGEIVEPQADDGGDIVVVASRDQARQGQQVSTPPDRISLREVYNETGRDIGEKIDQALGTKFAKNIGGRLGDALKGAQTGVFASNIASGLGIQQNATGAALGGAVGGVLSKLKPITEALGPFGAALTPVLGIVGGIAGGLFQKTKKASATITSASQDATLTGNSGAYKAAASKSAVAVQSSLTSIAEQLGGDTGDFAVSIGQRKKKYVVDTTGSGKTKGGGTLSFDSEEEAVAAALRDAIADGAIKGISEASQRILKSGQDLQKALEKALLIESVPKRLLAITDPVRSAITDLNTEFSKIISALNEGGATAEQYAQAQQLYDIERARTLAEAQKAATGAIDDYLKSITAGADSPLNKRTVYENASETFNKLAADVRAGKSVDQDVLVSAAKNFQDASRALFGSTSSFFNDFDALKSVLTQDKALLGVKDSTNDPSLPGSPFNSAAVQTAITSGTAATTQALENQTAIVGGILRDIFDEIRSGGGTLESAIAQLPGSAR